MCKILKNYINNNPIREVNIRLIGPEVHIKGASNSVCVKSKVGRKPGEDMSHVLLTIKSNQLSFCLQMNVRGYSHRQKS